MLVRMDQTQIQAKLRLVKNLSDFSVKAEIPRRTLERIKAGGHDANKTTLQLIEQALRWVKPEMKK